MSTAKDSKEPPRSGDLIESNVRPTYVPAAMAMSIMFTVWGVTTHWIVSVAGIGLMAWSLGSWVNEIRNEWKHR